MGEKKSEEIIIGIDLATKLENVGVYFIKGGKGEVAYIQKEKTKDVELNLIDGIKIIKYTNESITSDFLFKFVKTLCGNTKNVLIAIDVPFGWPIDFVNFVNGHQAVQSIDEKNKNLKNLYEKISSGERETFSKRLTDRSINTEQEVKDKKEKEKKNTSIKITPLSVSTDKLGATAIVGADLIRRLTSLTGDDKFTVIVGQHEKPAPRKIIEVYPTASLSCWLDKNIWEGYKSDKEKQKNIWDNLKNNKIKDYKKFNDNSLDEKNFCWKQPKEGNDHQLDAFICALTGLAFLNGDCVAPDLGKLDNLNDPGEKMEILKKEGWIWRPNRNTKCQSAVP